MRRLLPLAVVLLAPFALAHPETPDCGGDTDAGDHYFAATLLALPVACDAQLNDTWDSTDFYRFPCGVGQAVTAALASASPTLNLRAYGPVAAPYVLPPPLAWEDTRAGAARVRFTCTAPGDYRLQVLNGGLEQDLLDIPYRLEARGTAPVLVLSSE